MRAITLTGTALNAGITLRDFDLSVGTSKHPARADGKAYPTTVTHLRFVGKGDNVFEVNHGLHFIPLPS